MPFGSGWRLNGLSQRQPGDPSGRERRANARRQGKCGAADCRAAGGASFSVTVILFRKAPHK